ncbi:MAG: hypothetical protein J2P36_39850, partial [Ktedonobacteraceae bacterium]|nr:hypothetical protein [Ktedonobacteraceae bacterium]
MQQQMIEIQQLAASYDLGAFRAEYKPSTILKMVVFSIALFFILGIITPVIGIFSDVPGRAFPVFSSFLVLPLLLFLIVPIVFIGLLIATFRNRKLRVFVHEQGLVYLGKHETRVIRWDQIAFVWHQVTASTTSSNGTTSTTYHHKYMLQCQDGSTVELKETFSKLKELGKTIEWESARYQIPAAQNAFNAGQPVAFGELYVDQQGIAWQGNRLFWPEVKGFEINERIGSISIRKHGKWFRWAGIATGRVP